MLHETSCSGGGFILTGCCFVFTSVVSEYVTLVRASRGFATTSFLVLYFSLISSSISFFDFCSTFDP